MKVTVIGGSLGGLNAALHLRAVGCDVRVFERAPRPLVGLGAGIVLNPATVRYFAQPGAPLLKLDEISVRATTLRYVNRNGETQAALPVAYRFTSYNALYAAMLGAFDAQRYHLGETLTALDADTGAATFASGRVERADLLVCADGIRSVARAQLCPAATLTYAGYVSWRGLVTPEQLAPQDYAAFINTITYCVLPHGHMLIYPIPVVDRDGQRDPRPHLNWLWYRNVASGPALDALMTDRDGVRRDVSLGAGHVRDVAVHALRHDAHRELPAQLAGLVDATAQPFVQMIMDCAPEAMRFGRACLIGDAAFVARPHAAAGSAKAAEDGDQLARAVAASGDIDSALTNWNARQMQLGQTVLARTRDAGTRLQFAGTWRAGEPLPFGLYQTGDSEMP